MREPGTGILRNEITRNTYVWGALILCLGLILGAVYAPHVADILGLTPPTPAGWALSLCLSGVPLFFGQIFKIGMVRRLSSQLRRRRARA